MDLNTGKRLEEFTSKEVQESLQGEMLWGHGRETISRVSIDTRTLQEGDLFFAIKGERYDGHTFLSEAFLAQAVGAVVSETVDIEKRPGTFLIKVEDTTKALGQLASWYRGKFSIPVIAVTGSVGKTTTKEIVATLLEERFHCLKNPGNLNNEFGLPLTLLNLHRGHEILVTEMGMRNLGEIQALARIARPNVGIITNVGLTHQETLKNVENVARGKGELASSLPRDGHLILNGDDPRVRSMAKKSEAETILFGIERNDVHLRAHSIEDLGLKGIRFSLGGEKARFHLPIPGRHNIYNALAALAVGKVFHLSLEMMVRGLKRVCPSPLRMQVVELREGITLIMDTYNANPLSMEMALRTLASSEASRRIAVLGDMLELGEMSKMEHYSLGKLVKDLAIDLLFTTGSFGQEIGKGAQEAGMEKDRIVYVQEKKDLIFSLKGEVKAGDVVLLKASRGLALEEVWAIPEE